MKGQKEGEAKPDMARKALVALAMGLGLVALIALAGSSRQVLASELVSEPKVEYMRKRHGSARITTTSLEVSYMLLPHCC